MSVQLPVHVERARRVQTTWARSLATAQLGKNMTT